MMQAGDRVKTNAFTIDYWWPSSGHAKDLSLGNSVAAWIAQNQKVLDKKRSEEAVKLLREQFTYLTAIEVRHSQLQAARRTA
jgi:hypothetical protein